MLRRLQSTRTTDNYAIEAANLRMRNNALEMGMRKLEADYLDLWVRVIRDGSRTLDDVPMAYRERVRSRMEDA